MHNRTTLLALLMTSALVFPAAAQDSPRLIVSPGGSQVNQGGQEYMLVLVPKTNQQDGSSSGQTTGTIQGNAGTGSQGQNDIESFVRQVYERGYLQGRLAERQGGGGQLSRADLERLGQRLFVRGYVQGRYEESMDSDRSGQQQIISQAQQAVTEARQALREGNYREARRAMRRADQALPDQAGAQTSQAGTQTGQPEEQTGSTGQRSDLQGAGGSAGSNAQRGTGSDAAERIAPGTVTGELPIPIPEAQQGQSTGSEAN